MRSLHEPFDFPPLPLFSTPVCAASSKQNFLNNSNHFHALEMATFVPISYTYVPTAPRSKSATTRHKPTSKQSSIFDKIQSIKPSGAALSTPRPAVAAAANNRGDRPGIRGTGTIHGGSDKENDDENDDDDRDLPTIEELLFTRLQKQGFTTEDRGPDKTGLGVEEVASEERGGSIDYTGLTQSDNSGRSLDNPIVLLGDDDSSASEAEVDDGSRAKSTQPDAGLFDSPENAVDSTTPAPPSPDGWHDIDDFPETAQRSRRSEQRPSTSNCMRPHISSSRAFSEPLHDHISAAGQCTVRASSEATMSHPAHRRNQPPDHLPTDRSTADEYELVRFALNPDIFDGEKRQRQEEKQEDENYDNDNEDGKQLQQEAEEDVTAALMTGKVGDTHLCSKEGESPGLANRQHRPHSKPHRHSSKSHSPLNQRSRVTSVSSHGRFEGPGYSSPLCNEDQDEEEPQEQQGEKRRRHQDGAEEASSGIHQSESNERSHDTDDEDDEVPRPAKRRKLPLVSPDVPLTAPLEHSPNPFLRQPHGLTLSSTAQPEMDESPPEADHGHLSTPRNDEHHYTPPTSRSPSLTVESALVAEYREWPFQGFLKRITIGNQTTYNLEFALPRIPEHLKLSIHSGVSGAGSRESAEAVVSHMAVTSRKPGKELTKEQESLLAKMVHEDETWTEIGRHFPGHTL